MFSLKEKVTLVTGAGSGIGAAIAREYARAGAFVWIADLNEDAGGAVARGIREAGGSAEFMRLDVAAEAACAEAVRRVHQAHQRLDVLVNNAGVGHVGTLLQTSAADLDRLLAVNVRGVFNMSRAFLPGMLLRKRGNIVNMASIGGLVGIRDRVGYCATKFAVVGLTKSMALDHALDGIRINCICPGRVETPFVTARLQEYPDPEKARREMSDSQAQGRMGTPEEIAAAALYLASDESGFVTGTAFVIDGGFSAGK